MPRGLERFSIRERMFRVNNQDVSEVQLSVGVAVKNDIVVDRPGGSIEVKSDIVSSFIESSRHRYRRVLGTAFLLDYKRERSSVVGYGACGGGKLNSCIVFSG